MNNIMMTMCFQNQVSRILLGYLVVLKRTVESVGENTKFSTAESVEGTSLAFQSIDDVHGSDSLPLGVLGVGDGITDDILKENLKDTTGLFVNQT